MKEPFESDISPLSQYRDNIDLYIGLFFWVVVWILSPLGVLAASVQERVINGTAVPGKSIVDQKLTDLSRSGFFK